MRNETRFIGEIGTTPRAARPGDRTDDRPGASRRPNVGPALWDIEAVSEYLRVPVSSIYKMTGPSARHRIPHMRIGGRLRFRQTDIDRWLAALTSSDTDALERVRHKARKATHGHD